ncbi:MULTISPECIES: DNA-3-methyladenine glycosylase [unclassified Arthrobacter]|uniref:DNA-3-methyladenine glycosylase family protein n=1 Tax=unclassified Arthrobacter TaxID=235627 RepID=UPI00159EA796|nr:MULTISPECIES: 3-methyladenine DNA glycosylase [unclassified Arthrobacter]MCQ9164973.1 3-methyladenine DNA glycosylase [Arthrobacter sp. STN4]NVM97095.1 3-methyladenine DNA glycosylase [Arthrobacter sp. SDTb3-6]
MTATATHPGPALVWDAGGPYSLHETLGILGRGPGDRTIRLTPGTAWLAFNTPDGPATLGISQRGTELHARAWGPGAGHALHGAPSLLGRNDDWSPFDAPVFHATLPRLAREARRRHPAVRLPATGRMVDALVPAILEQKVTALEARRGYATLLRKFGSTAPGAGSHPDIPADLMVAPTPRQWAKIPSWEWHRAGVGPQRSATVLRAAGSASGLERLASLPATEAAAKMQGIPGIGVWTAAEVTQRTHGDADAVAVGDYHLAAFVGWALAGQPVDDAGMLELLEPWRGHRQRVVRMLYLSGFRKPARGPRMGIQDHRSH